jgi:hypothetical protein
MGKLYAYPPMHHHLISQPTGQPMTPAAKQSTLPEASSFSSSLTDPKAEHTLNLKGWTRTYQKVVPYASTSQKVWSIQILESRLRNQTYLNCRLPGYRLD